MKLTAEQQIKNSIKSYRDLLNHIGKMRTRFMNPWDIVADVENFVKDEIDRLNNELKTQPSNINESLKKLESESEYISGILEEVTRVSSELQEIVKTLKEEVK